MIGHLHFLPNQVWLVPKKCGTITNLTEEEMKDIQVEYKSIDEIVDIMRLAIANEEISLGAALETMFKFGKQLGLMALPHPEPESPAPVVSSASA